MEAFNTCDEVELGVVTTLPRTKWSQKKYHLDEIAKEMTLPQVVRISTDISTSDIAKKVDPNVPFLVYSRRRRTKVFAELKWWDKDRKAWFVEGALLEIPKDYTGWFELIKSKGDKLETFPLPCSTISEIADDACKKFLVRSNLIGHAFEETTDGDINLKNEVHIFPGEIMLKVGVFKRKWKIKTKVTKKGKEPETTFLKCVDHRNNILCVSLGHPGVFSPIYEEDRESDNPKNSVYQITDILDERLPFPLHVKLAFGWMPSLPILPHKWNGIMSLVGSRRPDTLVMCSLIPAKIPLIEMPVDIHVEVKLAEEKEKWSNDRKFKPIIDKCYKTVYPFVTTLKFIDLQYPMRDLCKGSDSKDVVIGRTTSPIEMTTFNPLDIYPPLQKTDGVSESWTLSFKDPEHDLSEEFFLKLNMSETAGYGDGLQIRTHNRLQKVKTKVNGSQTTAENNKNVLDNSTDMRALKDRQMLQREASC